MSAIAITSPVQYQLFQRSTLTSGSIPITGTYTYASSGHIEAFWNGSSPADIATITSGTGASYTGTLSSLTPWQGTLTVRIREEPATSTTKTFIGIGELFGCGPAQSNMAGRVTNNQTYSSTDGFKAVEFTYPGAGLGDWAELVDPYQLTGGGGSWIPLLATILMNDLHVPVGFMPGPSAGGTLWSNWLPSAAAFSTPPNLYFSMLGRLQGLGSVPRMLLSWLGESDSAAATSQATCNSQIDTVVDGFYAALGVKTMICILQNSTGVADADEAVIRAAIVEAQGDNSHVITGPDFSDKSSDDDFHFTTDANALMVAQRWAAKIESVITSTTAGHFSTVFAGALR